MTKLRCRFLRAVAAVTPSVLVSLREDVLPQYFWAVRYLINANSWASVLAVDHRRKPRLLDFKVAMASWAREYNIECDWVLETAYDTLILHESCLCCSEGPIAGTVAVLPGVPSWLLIDGAGPVPDIAALLCSAESPAAGSRDGGAYPDTPSPLEPPAPEGYVNALGSYFISTSGEWNPFYETWEDFEHVARRDFEVDLAGYKERIVAAATAGGGTRLTLKRTDEHFKWAAQYHCGGLTLAQILKKCPEVSDRTAIHRGIADVEHLLGLPRVGRGPGRPKTRTS